MIRSRIAVFISALATVILAIGMAPVAAADSSAQSAVLATAVTGQSQPGVDMFVRAAEASVDQFAAENHLSTVTWHNLTSLEASTNPCGYASASFAYYYCPVDGVAYIGVSQEAFFNDGTHYLAGSLLIAHEWGHHLQHVKDQNIRFGKQHENGADCVGGAWLRWFNDRQKLNLGFEDAVGFWNLAVKIEHNGDPADVHGSRYERGLAMFNGWQWGLGGCNGYVPTV